MRTNSRSVARAAVGLLAAVVLITGIAPRALAQEPDRGDTLVAQRRAAVLAARARRAGAVTRDVRGVTVVGVAWTSAHTPIPNPHLQLRDVLSGRVTATTVGNEKGEFAFREVDSGTYLVELVDSGDRVKAVAS